MKVQYKRHPPETLGLTILDAILTFVKNMLLCFALSVWSQCHRYPAVF